MHGERFMITTNKLDPKVYLTSKIVDMNPQGVIKLTLKQDEFNVKRDNPDLLVCDYWDDSGDVQPREDQVETPEETRTSDFKRAFINDNGELEPYEEDITDKLKLGVTVYFYVDFSDEEISPIWNIEVVDQDNKYTNTEKERLNKMMVLNTIDDHYVSLRPGKAGSLKGKTFRLSVSDGKGDYYSYEDLEVEE